MKMKLVAISFMLILGRIYGHPHVCDQQEACHGMLGALGRNSNFLLKKRAWPLKLLPSLPTKRFVFFLSPLSPIIIIKM